MIMYAGKQFGNDFRNGDDAVFGDSNRPRDENGTKIRPGLQGDKWSFREVNKKTDFSMYAFYGLGSIAGSSVLYQIPITYKQKRSSSDLQTYGFGGYETIFKPVIVNDPNYRIVEEEVKYNTPNGVQTITTEVLEIVETGLYQIEISGEFIMPSNYSANNSYQYKFYVFAMQPNDEVGYWTAFDQMNTRGCGTADTIKLSNTQVFQAGQKITAGYLHTWTTGSATIFGMIKAIKLG